MTGRAFCRAHAQPVESGAGNPWAYRQECPGCGESRSTLPYDGDDPAGRWHCVGCGAWWTPGPVGSSE